MTTELEARIERVKRVMNGEDCLTVYPQDGSIERETLWWYHAQNEYIAECKALASAHIAHLDAEAERKRERAEAVTEEWLGQFDNCTTDGDGWYMLKCHLGDVSINFSDDGTELGIEPYATWIDNPTKGQVLDLLAALKGEA